jgi:hypothetical protein
MFERCTLHIGTEKTGTTSIQRALAAARIELRQNGFLFPKGLGAPDGHRKLATYSLDDGRFDDGRRKYKLFTNEAVHQHRADVRKELEDLSTRHAGKHLILSSEHCHSRIIRGQEVARLADLLHQFCVSVDIVVYIRPQHELAVSLYSTALRVGHVDFPLIPQTGAIEPYYDYSSLLSRWSEVFGKSSVRPRIYNRRDLLQEDIVADFLGILGVDVLATNKVSASNTNVNGEAQAFLKLINPYLKEGRRNLPDIVERLGKGPSAAPSREEAMRFFALHESVNETVRREWFPERKALFDIDWSRYPDVPVVPSISMETAFEMFAEIWKAKN